MTYHAQSTVHTSICHVRHFNTTTCEVNAILMVLCVLCSAVL